MSYRLIKRSSLLVLLGILVCGCRAHPVSLAIMLIGDAVNDADIEDRAMKLVGKDVSAADRMFGARQETLEDTRRAGREMIVYPVKGDLPGSSRYVVEASNSEIVALTKTKQNIDGMEDVLRHTALKAKLAGKSAQACSHEGGLGKPILVLRNRDTENLVRCYDVRNITNLRGARYCVLRFGANDRCAQVTLVGVSASTKSDPAMD